MTFTDNYIYCFTDIENSVVYIGRGVGDRVDSHYGKHAHNDELYVAIKQDMLNHSFLAINITEEQAIALESFAISQYKPIYNKAKGSNTQNFFKPCVNTSGLKKKRSALSDMKNRTIDFFVPYKGQMGKKAWVELVNHLYETHHIDSWKTFNKLMAEHLGIEYKQLVTNKERFGRELDVRENGIVNGRLISIRNYMDEKEISSKERSDIEAKYWAYIKNIGIDVFVDVKKTKMKDVWKGAGITEDRSNKGRRSGQYRGDVMADGKVFESVQGAEVYWGLSGGSGRGRILSTTFPEWCYINWSGKGKDPSNTKVRGTEEIKKAAAYAISKSKRWWKHRGGDSNENYIQRLKVWNELERIFSIWFDECREFGARRFSNRLIELGFTYESRKFYDKLIKLLKNHSNDVQYENGLTEYQAALKEMEADSIEDRINRLIDEK
jgi:hypothetical protein